MVLVKAKQVADEMPGCKGYQANWGWYHRFQLQCGLQSLLLHGKDCKVDRNNPETLQKLWELKEIIVTYNVSCVYNMDKTGLFFVSSLTNQFYFLQKTLPLQGVPRRPRNRLFLLFVAMQLEQTKFLLPWLGSLQLQLALLGQDGLCLTLQRKAWMDVPTFIKWFNEIFEPHVCLKTEQRILLLLDNAPGHVLPFEWDGIRVAFFPPNVTSWKQPMDMGIIAALKKC